MMSLGFFVSASAIFRTGYFSLKESCLDCVLRQNLMAIISIVDLTSGLNFLKVLLVVREVFLPVGGRVPFSLVAVLLIGAGLTKILKSVAS
jgi:hypothetical protein